MKTPIQEVIDFINEINNNDTSEFNYYHPIIIEKLNELLDKENRTIQMTNAQFAIWVAKQEAPQIQEEVAEKVYKWIESKKKY
jgi:hypothetical protein